MPHRPFPALRRQRTLSAWILAGTLLLAACSQPPVPKDAFYRLAVPEPNRPLASAPFYSGTAEVHSIEADGVLSERAIAYVEPGRQALHQYSYHFWVEPPPQAIQRELAEYLRATGLFEKVVTPRFRIPADIEIQGRIGRLEQRLKPNGAARILVEMEFGVSRTRGLDLILLETYRAERQAKNASPGAAVAAMQAATTEIFARFARDLAARRVATH